MKISGFAKSVLTALMLFTAFSSFSSPTSAGRLPEKVTMSRQELMNKIKGGWAAQTIGVTYGGPTEFRYRGEMINDSIAIPWPDKAYVARTMKEWPGLYDDIYMDLTFVDVLDRLGLDAPVDSVAQAFAHASYSLWHANQAARYNILAGMSVPECGHWFNNPHADDIDYQIEADYAGLMSPGMPNAASEISDRIGHIMNYGDGWYGGVYMGAMYSLAFITDDIPFIVEEALKTIPARSKFHRCMRAVIDFHKSNPADWKACWQMVQNDWNTDVACDEGALAPLNIEATVNSAYVIIGLLYGNGDFGKTLEISTRCGQDSDCNPASAGGILGTAMGYDAIPEQWLAPLREAEDIVFAYTTLSLNGVYETSFRHALQNIERNGGKVTDSSVTIACQRPVAVRFEQSFPGMHPTRRIPVNFTLTAETPSVETSTQACTAVVLQGWVNCKGNGCASYVARLAVVVDDHAPQTMEMPAAERLRKLNVFWDFDMPDKPHRISVTWLNPTEGADVRIGELVTIEKDK